MGLGPGSENGRGRRSHRGGPEPDGAAAPGRARDQEPPGARRVPHGAAAQVPAAQYPAAGLRRRIDPDRRRADDHAAVRRRLHDRGARSPSPPTRSTRSAPARVTSRRSFHAWSRRCIRSRSTPRSRSGRRPCTRSLAIPIFTPGSATATRAGRTRLPSTRSSSPALRTDSQAAAGPAQGGGPDGHSAGRPVHPERPPGHQEGRQADRQGAQAHTFRADDRQGARGEGRAAGSGSGCRSGSTPAQRRGDATKPRSSDG